jgi:phage shock protein PspC (stress-responsive transcriptional regulator)
LPSLIRFLVIVAVLVGLAYAGMLAIVAYVTPQPREMTQTIPPQRLNK